MAVSNRYARATAWLACLSALLHLRPSEASRALLETTEGVATDADVATAGWPEGFAPGLWLTSVVKTAAGYAELEGKTGMLFSHPGVAETLLYVSPEESPDEILAAALLTLVEGATREDGTAIVYLSTRATTDDPFAAVFASDRCLSVALADRDGEETAHVLVKANATSLDDCPPPARPLRFRRRRRRPRPRNPGRRRCRPRAPPGCRPRRHVARRHPRRVDRLDPLRRYTRRRRPRRTRDRLLLRPPGLRAQRVALHRPGRSHPRDHRERGAFRGHGGGFRRRTRVEKRRVQGYPGNGRGLRVRRVV